MNYGGKIISPIREVMDMEDVDGIAFKCRDKRHAEQTRMSSLVAKNRNNMSFKTHVKDEWLFICKPGVDVYDEGANFWGRDFRE